MWCGVQVLSDVGAELSFQLPLTSSNAFPELFATIERDSVTLGVQTYGISVTTLEEVFMKVRGMRAHVTCHVCVHVHVRVASTCMWACVHMSHVTYVCMCICVLHPRVCVHAFTYVISHITYVFMCKMYTRVCLCACVCMSMFCCLVDLCALVLHLRMHFLQVLDTCPCSPGPLSAHTSNP